MQADIYLIKEYFKGFHLDDEYVNKLKSKVINNQERLKFLEEVVLQDKKVVELINSHYSSLINKFDEISEIINKLEDYISSYKESLIVYRIKDVPLHHQIELENNQEVSPKSIQLIDKMISKNAIEKREVETLIGQLQVEIDEKIKSIMDSNKTLASVSEEKNEIIKRLHPKAFDAFSGETIKYQSGIAKIVVESFYGSSTLNFNEAEVIEHFRGLITNDFKGMCSVLSGDAIIDFQVDKLKEIGFLLETLKVDGDLTHSRNLNYQQSYFLLFRIMKLIIYINLGSRRVNKFKESVLEKRGQIEGLLAKLTTLEDKNSYFERLKFLIHQSKEKINSKKDCLYKINNCTQQEIDTYFDNLSIVNKEDVTKLHVPEVVPQNHLTMLIDAHLNQMQQEKATCRNETQSLSIPKENEAQVRMELALKIGTEASDPQIQTSFKEYAPESNNCNSKDLDDSLENDKVQALDNLNSLKLLHNVIEHSFSSFIKQLSKSLIKPKSVVFATQKV